MCLDNNFLSLDDAPLLVVGNKGDIVVQFVRVLKEIFGWEFHDVRCVIHEAVVLENWLLLFDFRLKNLEMLFFQLLVRHLLPLELLVGVQFLVLV